MFKGDVIQAYEVMMVQPHSNPEVTNPSIAIDVSISKTFPVDLQNYYFFKYRKDNKNKNGTFSEVSSEMFSYGLRKTNVRKDLRLFHERQLFKSEDVRRVDVNVITTDFSQLSLSHQMPLLKQLAHCPEQWRRQTFFSAGAMGELGVLVRVL